MRVGKPSCKGSSGRRASSPHGVTPCTLILPRVSITASMLHAAWSGRPHELVRLGGGKHRLTRERAGCLKILYAGDPLLFGASAVAVAKQAVLGWRPGSLAVVAQVPLELRAWVRDTLGVRGEAMVSSTRLC